MAKTQETVVFGSWKISTSFPSILGLLCTALVLVALYLTGNKNRAEIVKDDQKSTRRPLSPLMNTYILIIE